MANKYLLVFFILCFFSCKRKTLGPEEYMHWVESSGNGLIKQETVGKVKYTVAYRPSDYQLAKSIVNRDSFSLKNSKTKNHAFIIKMEPADGKTQVLTIDATDPNEPFMRINYYLSEAQNHISLAEGTDTVAAENYIYERYYNLSPSQNMVIGFRQQQALGQKDLVLTIDDEVFHTGKIHFNFEASTLKNIPTLITQ